MVGEARMIERLHAQPVVQQEIDGGAQARGSFLQAPRRCRPRLPPPKRMVTATRLAPRRLPSISAWPVRRCRRRRKGLAGGVRAAIDVSEPIRRDAQHCHGSKNYLHRRGFVEFPQINVVDGEAGFLGTPWARRTLPGRCPSRRARSPRRRKPGSGPAASGPWRLAYSSYHRRGAVRELAGVAGRSTFTRQGRTDAQICPWSCLRADLRPG